MCESTYFLLILSGSLSMLIFSTGKPRFLRHWRKSASRSIKSDYPSPSWNVTSKKSKDFIAGSKTEFECCKRGNRSLVKESLPTINFSKFTKPQRLSANSSKASVPAGPLWVHKLRHVVSYKNVRSKSENSEWNRGTVFREFDKDSAMDMVGSISFDSHPSFSRSNFPMLTKLAVASALRRRCGAFIAHEFVCFSIMAHSCRWSNPWWALSQNNLRPQRGGTIKCLTNVTHSWNGPSTDSDGQFIEMDDWKFVIGRATWNCTVETHRSEGQHFSKDI